MEFFRLLHDGRRPGEESGLYTAGAEAFLHVECKKRGIDYRPDLFKELEVVPVETGGKMGLDDDISTTRSPKDVCRTSEERRERKGGANEIGKGSRKGKGKKRGRKTRERKRVKHDGDDGDVEDNDASQDPIQTCIRAPSVLDTTELSCHSRDTSIPPGRSTGDSQLPQSSAIPKPTKYKRGKKRKSRKHGASSPSASSPSSCNEGKVRTDTSMRPPLGMGGASDSSLTPISSDSELGTQMDEVRITQRSLQ